MEGLGWEIRGGNEFCDGGWISLWGRGSCLGSMLGDGERGERVGVRFFIVNEMNFYCYIGCFWEENWVEDLCFYLGFVCG